MAAPESCNAHTFNSLRASAQVRARFLYVPAYFLYHPTDIEEVLVTNSKNFRKAMSLRSPFFHRLVGNGLLTSEGDFWRRQRRLAQPAFHKQRVSNYGDVMVAYAEKMLAMSLRPKNGIRVVIQTK